ncbi:MAG: TolC family protein [Bacteroidales bacterium]|nr:TolC family protein [Bacteroidales bacterium]
MKNLLSFLFSAVVILFNSLTAQEIASNDSVMRISLEDAKKFAFDNNYDIINAMKEIDIAREKVKETAAIGLPQVSGSIAYNDFINIPTQLIPGEFFGEEAGTFIPVKFGTKYNMSLSATASQLIFSGEYIIGLQAMRAIVDLSQKQHEKALIELVQNVSQSYYLVLIAERNKLIVDSLLESLTEIRDANVALYENGFAEDIDVDQVNLLISDLNATLMNIQNNLSVSKNMLKFQMGLKLENEIELTDNLDDLLGKVDQEVLVQSGFDYRRNIDYRILQNQQELTNLNLKRYKSLYLPRLYAFVNYAENAQRNEWNFMDMTQQWYTTTIFGVQMDIPIFESGNRSAKINQVKIQLDQLEVTDNKLQAGLNIQYSTVRNNFINAWKVMKNKEQGLELSQKIYDRTRLKVLEGVTSSIELQQIYTQFLNSERDYVMAVLDLLNNKLELERLNN